MKTIDEVYQIVEESSHETAFNRGEAEKLYELALQLHDSAIAVEIGVEYGRSTTVIAEAQKEKKFTFIAIDNFLQGNGPEASAHFHSQARKHKWAMELIVYDSVAAAEGMAPDADIYLLHIDGDHEYEGVKRDINAWAHRVKEGGHIVFDDYTHPGLEGVSFAVNEYMEQWKQYWEFVGVFGDKLGVFKRI